MSDTRRNHMAELWSGGPDPEVVNEWKANLQAGRLRAAGLSYSSIAVVIREYHGVDRHPEAWRTQLQKQGAPRRRARGITAMRRAESIARG